MPGHRGIAVPMVPTCHAGASSREHHQPRTHMPPHMHISYSHQLPSHSTHAHIILTSTSFTYIVAHPFQLCEELFTPDAPHIKLSLAGVEIIANGGEFSPFLSTHPTFEFDDVLPILHPTLVAIVRHIYRTETHHRSPLSPPSPPSPLSPIRASIDDRGEKLTQQVAVAAMEFNAGHQTTVNINQAANCIKIVSTDIS